MPGGGAEFTKAMRKTHTIYMPDMLHYHNDLLKAAFSYGGYRLDVVPEYDHLTREVFRTVNADYCTCAIGIVGNLLTMLEDPAYQGKPIAFLEPQTGGACRAGNYYNLIINCLRKTGHEDIPVLSLNYKGEEKHSGFQINARMLFAAVAAVCYSDLLMSLLLQIKPYEKHQGETYKLYRKWITKLEKAISQGHGINGRKKWYEQIVTEFATIELDEELKGSKRKVGIVGEIYIKFSPIGNCHLEQLLEENDCEYRLGGFVNYLAFVLHTEAVSSGLLGESIISQKGCRFLIDYLCRLQTEMNDIMDRYGFVHDADFHTMHTYAKDIITDNYVIGDGWLITSEIVDHIRNGYDRVLSVHPFGCLVSHVGARGTLRRIHELYPGAGVHSVEFDYDQSKAIRESRILLAIH